MHHAHTGNHIDDYKLVTKIGRGSFGQIFYVQNVHTNLFYAMKLEKNNSKRKKVLTFEQGVYKKIEQSVYFPEFVKYGKTKYYHFLVMECFGPSIENLCGINIDKHLSLSTSLRLSIEMLQCIHEFHNNKFIHRDIKPANFVIRKSKEHPIVLIDFGLSRQYLNKDEELIKARERPGYVGTNMFASTGAYSGLELSQRDDLFSWFYSVIKIYTNELPWDDYIEDRNKTLNLKVYTSIEKLTNKMPSQFIIIYNIIISLSINETPNYNKIIRLINQAMEENGCSWNDPYDWELMSNKDIEKISILPITPLGKDDSLDIPNDLPVENERKSKAHHTKNEKETSYKNNAHCCNIY